MKLLKKICIISFSMISFISFAEVSVIVNKGNTDVINTKLIKRIYLGKVKSFPNGTKVNVLTLKDDASATTVFRQSALKKSNSQFKSYWSKMAFTGKGTPPKKMANDADMINAIKSDVTAIGFVDSTVVTTDVKVVARY
ncbi:MULTISPECIES: phosphate ABC transporter substrate-binding protein [Colwellia]|uniref:ABC transporter substrate-binding protein n=1 Tax=Colwellia marinimaniae TaxID=1513592 RepID=A0ABQ0MUP4_9GAMM|nr:MULTISPECIES: phosphate ABC transporter substrate-binding protein [Colwellia]GAW96083.1 ABC transporter substrate-binding protein [Colwellia marinimaniae]